MSSLLCAICLDTVETKIALSTTCGHIFCSECATRQFVVRPTCPVCRRAQTLEQLIRLYPEYGTAPFDALSSGATASSSNDLPLQVPVPPAPHSQPFLHTPSVHSLRLWIDVNSTFPWIQAGIVPAVDVNGSPIFLGLAMFKRGLHPCKICISPQGRPLSFVSYGGEEYAHKGTTLLLPFDPATMEWVVTANGKIPHGRRPVEGGHEPVGAHEEALFHARAVVNGASVLGKAGERGHMCGANVPYRGKEHGIVRGYEVLCWRD